MVRERNVKRSPPVPTKPALAVRPAFCNVQQNVPETRAWSVRTESLQARHVSAYVMEVVPRRQVHSTANEMGGVQQRPCNPTNE